MVRPEELVHSLINELSDESEFPDRTNFMDHEPAINTEPVKLPVVVVSPETQARVSEANTDFVDYVTNDDGERVGRIYQSLYDIDIAVSVWTAQDSKFDARELGRVVRDTLYAFDNKGASRDLTYDDGERIHEVWDFRVGDGQHTNDLSTSPPLRRWQQLVTISASEQYTVTQGESPIKGITL